MKYHIICVFSIVITLLGKESLIETTPLDDYVYAPDPHYNYTLIDQHSIEGGTVYIYNFTSQKWYDG
jgi:hypothetical protein